MSNILEKKVGDLVKDLQGKREQLRRELDKVNAQLELLSALANGTAPASKVARQIKEQTESPVAAPKRKRGRPAKRRVGRPAGTSSSKKTSANGKTLKEELISFAKSHGGALRVREASEALVKSGRYETKEQASANIHAAIKYYTSTFHRDQNARGVYKVKA